MSLGPTELLAVIFNVVVLLAVPLLLIIGAILLFRRIRHLEARITKLEESKSVDGSDPGHS